MSIKYQGETGIRFLYSKAGQSPLPSPKPPRPRAPKLNSTAGLTSKPFAAHAQKFRCAFSPNEVRHNFIIQSLPKPSWYSSRPYLYTCARCKWTFRVNDSSGSITPLDQNGEVLPEPDRSRRIETFAQGPCGVFPAFTVEGQTQARRPGWIR
jgi:hypothetical protein